MAATSLHVGLLYFLVHLLQPSVGRSSRALSSPPTEKLRVCEKITIPLCTDVGYNYTSSPFENQFHHGSQEEAGMEVHQFYPLVNIKCSPDLRFFLCSMYAPICMEDYHEHLPPCRSVCQRAKAGCAPLMLQYNFPWPEKMNCDELPVNGQGQLCMDNFESGGTNEPEPSKTPLTTKPVRKTTQSPCQCRCGFTQIKNSTDPLYGQVTTGGLDNCAVSCESPFLTENELTFTRVWISVWAILCLISTLITIVTFLIDMKRFHYPERPIIFVSGCYTMVALGFIVRLSVGHEAVACTGETLHYGASNPAACVTVFLLLYAFSMAAALWWVILTFTWFLAAGLKWGQEAIAGYAHYFHIVAWVIPTVQSVVILALKYVDSDNVAGLCFVGGHNNSNLLVFVIIPHCLYLLLGSCFLLAGIIALCKIRNEIRHQGRSNTEKLERLMIRIGVFSILYTVPAIVTVACYFYELQFRETWNRSKNCPCEPPGGVRPDVSVFMLKYLMFLAVGITSGFWVWSGKTVKSWTNFYRKLCGKENPDFHAGQHRCALHKCPNSPLFVNPPYYAVKSLPSSNL